MASTKVDKSRAGINTDWLDKAKGSRSQSKHVRDQDVLGGLNDDDAYAVKPQFTSSKSKVVPRSADIPKSSTLVRDSSRKNDVSMLSPAK